MVAILFFVSGFPALLYQIVWQRALFTLYGVNIESVTVVVAAFMLGLGAGSLIGGQLSRLLSSILLLFSAIELVIGIYGLASLPLFHWIGSFTAGVSSLQLGVLAFLLVLVPTVLMGATLPLLTHHLVSLSGNVGRAVGALYFANTLGSAAALFRRCKGHVAVPWHERDRAAGGRDEVRGGPVGAAHGTAPALPAVCTACIPAWPGSALAADIARPIGLGRHGAGRHHGAGRLVL